MQGPLIRGNQIQIHNSWATRIHTDLSNVHFFTNRKLTEKAVLIAKGEIAKFLQVLIAAQNEKSPNKKSRRVSLTYSRAWRLKQAQRASKRLIAIRSKGCTPRKQTSSSLTCKKKKAKASNIPSTTFINHRT